MCKTIVCIKKQKYELKRNWFRDLNPKCSCDMCAAYNHPGCSVNEDFDCREFDTDEYSVYLVRVNFIAQTIISSDTPSGARREDAEL